MTVRLRVTSWQPGLGASSEWENPSRLVSKYPLLGASRERVVASVVFNDYHVTTSAFSPTKEEGYAPNDYVPEELRALDRSSGEIVEAVEARDVEAQGAAQDVIETEAVDLEHVDAVMVVDASRRLDPERKGTVWIRDSRGVERQVWRGRAAAPELTERVVQDGSTEGWYVLRWSIPVGGGDAEWIVSSWGGLRYGERLLNSASWRGLNMSRSQTPTPQPIGQFYGGDCTLPVGVVPQQPESPNPGHWVLLRMPCRLREDWLTEDWSKEDWVKKGGDRRKEEAIRRRRLEKVGNTSDYELTPDSLENWLWVLGPWCTQPTRHPSNEARLMRNNMRKLRPRTYTRVIPRGGVQKTAAEAAWNWFNQWQPSVGISYADWPGTPKEVLLPDVERSDWRPMGFRRGWETGWIRTPWTDQAVGGSRPFGTRRTQREVTMAYKKEEELTVVNVKKFPADLWLEAGVAARRAKQTIRDWLADAIREKLERGNK